MRFFICFCICSGVAGKDFLTERLHECLLQHRRSLLNKQLCNILLNEAATATAGSGHELEQGLPGGGGSAGVSVRVEASVVVLQQLGFRPLHLQLHTHLSSLGGCLQVQELGEGGSRIVEALLLELLALRGIYLSSNSAPLLLDLARSAYGPAPGAGASAQSKTAQENVLHSWQASCPPCAFSHFSETDHAHTSSNTRSASSMLTLIATVANHRRLCNSVRSVFESFGSFGHHFLYCSGIGVCIDDAVHFNSFSYPFGFPPATISTHPRSKCSPKSAKGCQSIQK